MSTYSPNLRIQLITTGDQVGTWGTTTNTNLGTLLEDAISGYTSVSVTTANQALTANNGSADQSRNASLALTTTTTAAFAVYAPPAEKTYTIYNASSYTATIYNSTVLGNTTAAGSGVAIPAGKTVTVWSDGTDFRFQNNHLSSLTLTTDLAVADGGTGASTAADARTNLGLGTIATQNSSSVSITGGSITGITDLAVADGGTGASTAANARTNLGVAIGSDVQAYNAGLADIAGLAKTDGNLIVGNGTNWVAESGSTARTSLGLGTIATQNSNSVTITGGSITGITDLAVADGGTGASSFTSGSLIKGNGTSALSVASAADIVSAIGSTAVTNATNATNATTAATVSTTVASGATGTTQTFGTSNTTIATTAFVQAALQALHPVGSIYINATNNTNPGTLLGFGTWTAFGAGRVPVGFDSGNALFDTAEETGGSADAITVSHTHTATVTDPGHRHFVAANVSTGSTYPSTTVTSSNQVSATAWGNNSESYIYVGTSTDATIGRSSSSTTGITVDNSTTGSSGTNANYQPYITVYMWKRTA